MHVNKVSLFLFGRSAGSWSMVSALWHMATEISENVSGKLPRFRGHNEQPSTNTSAWPVTQIIKHRMSGPSLCLKHSKTR